jgi:hypothetical protein
MIKFLTDENYNNIILNGVLLRLPELDVVRVQEVELMNTPDEIVLAWTAQENRVVLTHDVTTLLDEAYRRVAEGLLMPGVMVSPQLSPVAPVINDLVFIIGNSSDDEWKDSVVFLPV